MKKLFLLCMISLLLMGCSQPNNQKDEASVPSNDSEEVVEVIASTDSEPQSIQETSIIPPDDQIVQVIFTQAAMDQIATDLDDPDSRNKVLKIKPAID